jgi:hypothetical protein
MSDRDCELHLQVPGHDHGLDYTIWPSDHGLDYTIWPSDNGGYIFSQNHRLTLDEAKKWAQQYEDEAAALV